MLCLRNPNPILRLRETKRSVPRYPKETDDKQYDAKFSHKVRSQRPKLSDGSPEARGLQPERDGRVRCGVGLGIVVINLIQN